MSAVSELKFAVGNKIKWRGSQSQYDYVVIGIDTSPISGAKFYKLKKAGLMRRIDGHAKFIDEHCDLARYDKSPI